MRLVVTWGDHVRVPYRLPAVLCRERERHVQEDHRLATLPALSRRGTLEHGGARSHAAVSLFFPIGMGLVAHRRGLSRLLTWSNHRVGVEEMRTHPLFEGVEWTSLRMMPAPRPPTLKSITDTSYFPTEEYADVPEVPAGVEKLDADKDLAFLG